MGTGDGAKQRPSIRVETSRALRQLIEDDAVGQLRRLEGLMATLGSEDGVLKLDWVEGVARLLDHETKLEEIETEAREIWERGIRHIIWAGKVAQAKHLSLPSEQTSSNPAFLRTLLDDVMMVGVSMGMTSEEPITHLTWFTDLLEQAQLRPADALLVMTLPGSYLEHFAHEHQVPSHPLQLDGGTGTGGRMSAPTTRVFLLSAALHLTRSSSEPGQLGKVLLHDLVEEKALGRLVLGNALVPWWRSQVYYDSGAWRATWKLDGGGVLMNQSIHSIDLLQWLMGPVKSIYAYTDTLVHHMETEDVAVAVLRFASGALGTIAATTGAYPGVTTRIEVFGEKGSAVIENDSLSYLHLARDDREEIGAYGASPKPKESKKAEVGASTVQDPAALSATGHALQIADMNRAIREGGTPLVDGYAARRPVEIILAVYESALTHEEIPLP